MEERARLHVNDDQYLHVSTTKLRATTSEAASQPKPPLSVLNLSPDDVAVTDADDEVHSALPASNSA